MGTGPMRSSEYFRAQARLYRDIAQMISDRQASERAMTFAAEYLERAEESERQEQVALEHSLERGHP